MTINDDLSGFLYIFFWSGVAVDGPGKDHTANISLYKKTGKVKALDEEIYSMLNHFIVNFIFYL